MTKNPQSLITLGWREYVALPDLGLDSIAAKVDTGARTSCLHAFNVRSYNKDGALWVRFGLHPLQDNTDLEIWRDAAVIDQRAVTDSGGHREQRYVISSMVSLGGQSWPIELTLTSRDNMRFRMLLGRTAMNGRCQVNPEASWLLGKPDQTQLAKHQQGWQSEIKNSD